MEVHAADYFLKHVERICKEDYLPDSEDLVHLRYPTTEITTMAFNFNKVTFSLKDVGGQIQYRDEWPTIFRDSHIVLFIISIADYCKFSKNADEGDENSRNRLVEARTLLKDICHQKDLASRPFVLIFNKMDLFFENLKSKPLSSCKVFKGAEPKKENEDHEKYVERCTNYVIQYFEKAVNSSDDPRCKHQCQSYMTSATDTEIFLNVMQKALVGVIDLLSSQMHSFGL
jgi:GTPase SAR1 family protein